MVAKPMKTPTSNIIFLASAARFILNNLLNARMTKKFENKSAGVNTEINSRNISAATDILDHHTKESNLKDADLLALGLIDNSSKKTLGEKLMPSNQTKKKTNISSEVINPSQTIGKSTKSDKTTDTDFDLDL